jgi:hypothetical protein
MTPAETLAESINLNEYWKETTDEDVQYAKDNNLMICTGSGDDNISLYWAFEEEVWLSSTGSFHIWKMEDDRYFRLRAEDNKEEIESLSESTQWLIWDIDKLLWWLIEIKVNYNSEWDWYLFDMSDNKHPTFEILEDGEKYCIWCVVDLSSLTR